MAWTTPRTAVTGEVTTAANLNETRDNLNFLYEPPTISVTVASPQNITHNTATAVTFNAEAWKDGFTHSNVTSTDVVTAITDGICDIDMYCGWDPNVAGIRHAEVRRNGSVLRASPLITPASTGAAANQMFLTDAVAGGDDITMAVLQTSGGNLLAYPGLKITWRRGLA